MSDWQTQNEENWKRIDFALTELRGPGIVWMTCDSYRHSQRLFADFKARFGDRTHYEIRIKDSSEGHLRRILGTRLPQEAFEGEAGMVMVHVFGLESQVGIGLSPANEDFFAALNLDREALFLRTPFIIIFWTDLQTQIKVQRLAQDFWDWVTMKFPFDAPVEAVKAEIDWVEEPKQHVAPERREELLQQNARYIGKLENLTRPRDRLSHLEVIANNYQALQDYEKAAYYREKVLEMRDLLLPQQIAWHMNELGFTFYRLGKWDEALQAYEECLGFSQKINDTQGQGWQLNNIGNIHREKGHYQQAFDFLNRSLSIHREGGFKKGEGLALNSLSQLFAEQGELTKALAYLEQSLLIREELGDKPGEAIILNNIGQVYDALGNQEQAIASLIKSLHISQAVGDRQGEAVTLNNLSLLYSSRGDYAKAISQLSESFLIAKDIGDIANIATTLHNIGSLAYKHGKYSIAVPFFRKALSIAEKLGSPNVKYPNDYLTQIQQMLGEETYNAILAQIPKDEDPFDLSSLPQLQID